MIKSVAVLALILVSRFFGNAQEVSTYIGLDTTSVERNEILHLWKNYLKSNPDKLDDKPNWLAADKSKYKSYDLLKSEGFLSPSAADAVSRIYHKN